MRPITDHVFRPAYKNMTRCAYMNCRKLARDHERSVHRKGSRNG